MSLLKFFFSVYSEINFLYLESLFLAKMDNSVTQGVGNYIEWTQIIFISLTKDKNINFSYWYVLKNPSNLSNIYYVSGNICFIIVLYSSAYIVLVS